MSEPRRFWRDFWQLDIPLVVVVTGCAAATIVELSRAEEGVWRAWVYTFEWPLIALFAFWIWYRYRIRKGIRRPRASRAGTEVDPNAPEDPALSRWQEYQRKLRENATPEDQSAGE